LALRLNSWVCWPLPTSLETGFSEMGEAGDFKSLRDPPQARRDGEWRVHAQSLDQIGIADEGPPERHHAGAPALDRRDCQLPVIAVVGDILAAEGVMQRLEVGCARRVLSARLAFDAVQIRQPQRAEALRQVVGIPPVLPAKGTGGALSLKTRGVLKEDSPTTHAELLCALEKPHV
jgi:hypothetical protein